MANVPRFFAGKMGGVQRVRLSKPGFDASSGSLRDRQLQFDTNWNAGLTIHAQGIINPGTTKFSFEPLDYIPHVFVASCNKSGVTQYWGKLFELDKVKVSNKNVKVNDNRDRHALIVVFRAPAFDSRNGAGYSNGSVPRILIGKGGANVGSEYGIFISRPKYDVTKCDEENLLFTSTRVMPNRILVFNRLILSSVLDTGSYSAKFTLMAWPGFFPLIMANIVPEGPRWLTLPSSRKTNSSGTTSNAQTMEVSFSILNDNGNLRLLVVVNNIEENPDPIRIIAAIYDRRVK